MTAGTPANKIPSYTAANGSIRINTHRTADLPASAERHTLRIETADFAEAGPTAKNPGAPMIKTRLRVVDGSPDDGKAVWHTFQLEGGFRYLFEHMCEATGLAGQDDLAIEMLVGQEFDALLKHEEYEGRLNARIQKIFYDADAEAVSGTPKAGLPF